MSYTRQALGALPFAIALGLFLYIPFLIQCKKKNKNLPLHRHLANYTFVAYVIMLVLITFLMGLSFGEMGRNMNIVPFKAFKDAYLYGNDMLVNQYILNIIMFIPLGFLLPMVFRKNDLLGELWHLLFWDLR